MPTPEEAGQVAGVGSPVFHDAVTGQTSVLSVGHVATTDLGQVPGRDGDDGDPGLDESQLGHVAGFVNMTKINNTESAPWRMNVKLVMRFVDQVGADRWFGCSGSMVDAETVLAAGHCVYARTADGPDIFDWAEEIWVYPGRDGSFDPYGFAQSTEFGAWTGWTNNGSFDSDAGLIRVTRAVGSLTGWFGNAWDGSCNWIQGKTYNNASYPGENCPINGLHNGADMYYWYGNFDSCPGNQLQINTGGGNCFDTVWGGMSGSGAYYLDNGARYVHAVCSNSNRTTSGRYCKLWGDWATYMNGTFIPESRGNSFDLQALDTNASPASIPAGQQLSLANFLATNPTNAGANGTWTYRVYLSTNDDISAGDTLLSTQSFAWNFGAMGSVRVNMAPPTIPIGTSPGNYFVGVILDSGTDGNSSNNDTDGWDATPITVTQAPPPNDFCGSATVIATTPYDPPLLATGGATTSGSDPLQTCSFGGASKNSNSVWYRFTPPCNGTVDVSTCGSNYDTVVSVLRGTCGNLIEMGCDDDTCGTRSQINGLAVIGGQTIYIDVTDFGQPGGGNLDFHFDFTANVPFNDACANAATLGVPASTPGTTCGASVDDAPFCGTSNTAPGVWYRVMGTGATMTATTCNGGTDYDTKISVFCDDCPSLPCVGGNDDTVGAPAECDLNGNNRKSTVSWCSQYGAEYLILVHGFQDATGEFQLDISDDGAPCSGGVDCGGSAIGACCSPDGGACQGGTCGTFATCGGNDTCICAFDSDNGGRCFSGTTPCGGATPCPNGNIDCPAGEFCLAQSCCDGPVCGPLCPSSGGVASGLTAEEARRLGIQTVMGDGGGVAGIPRCIEMPESVCLAAEGLFQGNGESCADVVCPLPTGACCVDGACTGVIEEAECLAAGGAWFEGENCETAVCPVSGACCASYECTEGFVCNQVGIHACNGLFNCVCANRAEGGIACVPILSGCSTPCTSSADCPSGSACIVDSCCGGPVCMQAQCGGGAAAAVADVGEAFGDAASAGQIAGGAAPLSCVEVDPTACDAWGGLYQGDNVLCVQTACPGPVGACCVDGECLGEMEELPCLDRSGTWQRGETCATVTCPQRQACCFQDGSCTDSTRAACLLRGGQPQGVGTDCATSGCAALEACCLPDGRCGEVTPNECRERGGTPLGPDSRCLGDRNGNGVDDACEFDVPCEDCGPGPHWVDECRAGDDTMPSGAVIGLDTDGDCRPDKSLRLGGPVRIRRSNPQDDSRFFPRLRPVDGHFDVIDTEMVGMMLSGDGVVLTAGEGLGYGGVLKPSYGAIAEQPLNKEAADSFFDVFFEVDFGLGLRGYNRDPLRVESDVTCLPPVTTYIHPDSCIPIYTSLDPRDERIIAWLVTADHTTYPGCGEPAAGDCLTANDTPYCDDAACCESVCAIEPRCCSDHWAGICAEYAREVCLVPEACCLRDGTCQMADPRICDRLGGVPHGTGSDCSNTSCPLPPQACCLPSGACLDVDPATCEARGGLRQGVGTSCASTVCPLPPVACCLPTGDCLDTDAETCRGRGGVPQGSGTVCDGTICPLPPEACCLPRGFCADVDPRNCRLEGGTPLGPNSVCLGDRNGNDVDDACEPNAPCDECGPGPHWIDRPPCPPGIDRLPSGAKVGIDLDFDCRADASLVLNGPSAVARSGARDDSVHYPGTRAVDGHLDVIDTEVVMMHLTNAAAGASMRAGVGIGPIPLRPTLGVIAEEPSDPAIGDSFFDVFFEIEIQGMLLYNQEPLRVKSQVDCIPPDTSYIHPTDCIKLFTSPIPNQGEHVGNLVSAEHGTFLECGSDVAGDCFQPNGTPFCDEATCCATVCERSPYCCEVEWNDNCAGMAREMCREPEACCLPEGRCAMTAPEECLLRGGTALGPGTRCEGDADGNLVDDACQADDQCEDCGPGPHWVDSCPSGGDNMPTGALIGIDRDLDCEPDINVVLSGPVSVWRSNPLDDSVAFPGLAPVDGHREVIDTEMVSMNLTGSGIALIAGQGMGTGGALPPTLGAILENSGDPALADSFFDVFFEVQIGSGVTLYNHDPLRVKSEVDCLPPNARYLHPGDCVPLYDAPVGFGGEVVANLVAADHSTYPECGDPTTGDCYRPNGTPFCDDADCCAAVCERLPQCCVSGWDPICAEAAAETCRPVEACCLRDGSCHDVDLTTCRELQGRPQGPGTDCANVDCLVAPEACCLPDGVCANLPPADCLALDGQPNGPETACEGDCNQNGVDNACELLGDFDGDGDVDKVDYVRLGRCLSGPRQLASPNCVIVDMNCDGYIDMRDVHLFWWVFTGPIF